MQTFWVPLFFDPGTFLAFNLLLSIFHSGINFRGLGITVFQKSVLEEALFGKERQIETAAMKCMGTSRFSHCVMHIDESTDRNKGQILELLLEQIWASGFTIMLQ